MEKKTNKTKLEISYFWENQLYRKAIASDKIEGNYALSANSTKNMLIRVFLHAEFISAMKTAHNLTIFIKMHNNRKMNNLVLSVSCLRFLLKV